MYKVKTHKSIKKRFKITANGKLMMHKASRSHLLEKKTSKRKQHLRKTVIVNSRDRQNFRYSLLYIN